MSGKNQKILICQECVRRMATLTTFRSIGMYSARDKLGQVPSTKLFGFTTQRLWEI